jgi:hypothetical protein
MGRKYPVAPVGAGKSQDEESKHQKCIDLVCLLAAPFFTLKHINVFAGFGNLKDHQKDHRNYRQQHPDIHILTLLISVVKLSAFKCRIFFVEFLWQNTFTQLVESPD